MSQISVITSGAPVTAGVTSITGNSGGALTGALSLVGATGSGITVAGAAQTLTIDSTGVAFSAYNENAVANVTGAGALYTAQYDTELYDTTGSFAANVFTAPSTGQYSYSTVFTVSGVTVNQTSMAAFITTTSNTARLAQFNAVNVATSGVITWGCSVDLPMTAGDTARVQLQVNGTTAVVDYDGSAAPDLVNVFSGHKIR